MCFKIIRNKQKKNKTEMKKIKIKALGFEVEFNGNGCVNWDSNDQKVYLQAMGLIPSKNKDDIKDNVKFAKKSFVKTDNGIEFVYKVSNDAIRHSMWQDKMPFSNQNHAQIPYVYYSMLGRPCMLERGYMFAKDSTSESFKKKSCVCLSDAVEISSCPNSKVSLEVHSRAGSKDNISLFYEENVGNLNYKSVGCIDLTELQFISMDDKYDRRAVSDDNVANFDIYTKALTLNLPFFNEKPSYYYMENSYLEDEWAEKGILLSHDSVDWMVKDILARILKVNIWRSGAYFKTTSVKILYTDENGVNFEDVITLDTLKDYYFDVDTKYIKADEIRIQKSKKEYERLKKQTKKASSSPNKTQKKEEK